MGTSNSCRRVPKFEMVKYVMKTFKLGKGKDEIISECEESTKNPMIVIISSANTNRTEDQHFIKLDKQLIPIQRPFGFNNVIEIFFKAFACFSIKYTPEAYNLFCLFEFICNINLQNRPSVRELMNFISNV
jgi:hypothetical protein